MSKVTIIDIAEALGITPSTVSRALSGNPYVKESTRKAVQDKAKELGYERNIIASNLRSGKTSVVGIVIPRIHRNFFSIIISAAESVLYDAGYSVMICQSHEKEEDEILALKTLTGSRVGGILISHSLSTKTGKGIMESVGRDVKLVQFDRVFHDIPGSTITNDDSNGAYNATMHLIKNGYTRIGAFSGYQGTDIYIERYDGYKRALEHAGIPLDESIVFPGFIDREAGYASAAKALERGCDALYCTGDYSALGAMDYLREKGISIPKEFGLVGTANEDFTSLISPSLTSTEQNPREIGEKAALAIIRLMRGETSGEDIVVKTKLLPRESSDRKGSLHK